MLQDGREALLEGRYPFSALAGASARGRSAGFIVVP